MHFFNSHFAFQAAMFIVPTLNTHGRLQDIYYWSIKAGWQGFNMCTFKLVLTWVHFSCFVLRSGCVAIDLMFVWYVLYVCNLAGHFCSCFSQKCWEVICPITLHALLYIGTYEEYWPVLQISICYYNLNAVNGIV